MEMKIGGGARRGVSTLGGWRLRALREVFFLGEVWVYDLDDSPIFHIFAYCHLILVMIRWDYLIFSGEAGDTRCVRSNFVRWVKPGGGSRCPRTVSITMLAM